MTRTERRKGRIATALLGLMVAGCLSANAQSRTDSVQHIDEVIVTGRETDRSIIATVPTQQMDKRLMERLGLTELADAVKKLIGASVKDYGGIGGMKTVSVRNLGANHTAVSYDGVTISNTQAGQIDIGRYSLNGVENVSLAIGQADDIMQSARHYSAAGILEVTTERPHFENGSTSMLINVGGGSFGLVSPTLRLWQKIGSHTAISADANYMRADGAYPFTLVNGRERTREKRYNSDIASWKGEVNLYHTFRDSSEISTKAYYYYSERGLPGVVILYNPNTNERLWDENFFAQTVYRKRINDRWRLHARLKYNHSWNRYEDTNSKYQNGKQTDITRQNEYYASATIGWNPLRNVEVALAEDLAYNNLRSNIASQPNPERYTSLTALSAQYRNDRITINGNITGTYMSEQANLGKSAAERKRLSPALSVSYRLLRNESLFLRAMMKNTFRVPTFTDMYYQHIGNTNLVPEKATEWNIGMTWNGRLPGGISIRLTADAYYNKVKDKIVAFPTTYVWKMTNLGKVDIKGIDASVAMQIPITKSISAEIAAAYTLQNATDKTDPETVSYGTQIPYTPRHSGNGSLTLNTPWVNIGYSLIACGERWSMIQHKEEYRLSSYYEHGITLTHEFKFKGGSLLLSGSIKNLTDKQYEIIQYYPMPGRSFYVSGTLKI